MKKTTKKTRVSRKDCIRMSDCEINCDDCKSLRNVLNHKEEEIKKLKLQIQNLTKVLDSYRIRCERCCFCCNSKQCPDENSSAIELKIINTDPGNVHHSQNCNTDNSDEKLNSSTPFCTDIPNLTNSSTDSSTDCKNNDDGNTPSISKELCENLNHNDDYIYDEESKMYYSVSTGFYYDTNTELFYVPQNGCYYKYDYSKHKYELYNKKTEQTCDSNVHDACDSVADKVDNLNINDSENFLESNFEEKCSYSNHSQDSPVQKHYTININLTSEVVQPQSRNIDDEVPGDSSKDWLLPEGSNTTVKDLVTEVAEQSSGMSDYIYDEKCSMYYCKSNGNYYDPIRKLLYDPRARIYYLFIQETLSYEFYCKADAISGESNQEISADSKEHSQKPVSKAEARKRFWKRKQVRIKKSTEKKEILSSDIKETSVQEDESTINENFSSPEAGEIFSSDSESELMKDNPVSPAKEESSPPCPPCIRAIVEHSSKLKIGSLILITCTGAVIGRESSNTVSVPDIGVSKVHAEITFDNESWKYIIEDLGSQNGTYVNKVRLSETKQKSKPQVLSHGDKLAFGSCKLLIHIHEGYETCDRCEPGQVMAELSSKEVKAVPVLKTRKEKEKERRKEMKRLKKKYGLKGMKYCDGKNCVPAVESGYEDKAEIRRKTVGSQNPYEKTEVASMDTSMSELNKGYQMLKKLGWKEGDSLGLKNSGISEPIPIRPWISKAGLGCTDAAARAPLFEDRRRRKWVKAQERYFQLST